MKYHIVKMSKVIAVSVAIAIIIGVLTLTELLSSSRISSEDVITVGAVLPLTGPAALYGEHQKNALLMAQKEINDAGGVLGKRIELIIEDEHTDATTAVSAMQKLVHVHNVDVVIGGAWNFVANAMIPVADAQKKVLISPSSVPDGLEQKSDFFFTTIAPVESYVPQFTAFLQQYPKSNVAIVVQDNPFGHAHLAAYRTASEHAGHTVVAEVVLPKVDQNDVLQALTTLQGKDVDIILKSLNVGDEKEIVQRAHDLRMDVVHFGYTHLKTTFTQGNVAPEVMEGVFVYEPSPSRNEFVERYTAQYGMYPTAEADTTYDALFLVKEAIVMSGGNTDAESVRQELTRIHNFEGVSGPIDFTHANHPHNKVACIEVFEDGVFHPVALGVQDGSCAWGGTGVE
jgi:branched-chain amino acid transport system substrate-binding protein